MLTLYVLAFLSGSPIGRPPIEYPVAMSSSPAFGCPGVHVVEDVRRWTALHPGAVVVGIRCRPSADRIELAGDPRSHQKEDGGT